MARYQLADLREKKYALNERCVALLDDEQEIRTREGLEADARDTMAGEKRAEYERVNAEFLAITEQIDLREKHELGDKPKREERDRARPGQGDREEQVDELRKKGAGADEIRSVLSNIRQGHEYVPILTALDDSLDEEQRSALIELAWRTDPTLNAEVRTTLNTLTGADGKNTVPVLWGPLVESLREFSPIRQHATIYTTAMGGEFTLPRVSADADLPTIVAEQANIPDDGEGFDNVVIKAFMYSRITKASDQMMADSVVNIEAFVGRRLGQDLGLATGNAYSVGSGAGVTADTQPQGVFTGATAGVTGAASIGYANLVTLQHSVLSPYRKGAIWLMKDSTLGDVRTLTDSQGRPLYQIDMRVGAPDTLLGNPVECDPFAPTNATAQSPVLFGNLKLGYAIRDVLGVQIMRLSELYAGANQTGWRGRIRSGGAITDGKALRKLTRA